MSKRKWSANSIKAALHDMGWTLTEMAAREGVHRTTLSIALRRPNARGEEIIARYLSVPAEELWPDRYPKTPHRIYDSRRHGPSTSQKAATGADIEAAA